MTLSAAPRPWFKLEEAPAGRASPRPDALRDLFDGRLNGLILRGALARELAHAAVARIEAGGSPVQPVPVPDWRKGIYMFGWALCLHEGGPEDYLRHAAEFRPRLKELFGEPDIEGRLEGLLAGLSGGRPVELVRSADGRPYVPATIRYLPEGSQFVPHFENSHYRERNYMRRVNELVDPSTMLSFLLLLRGPRAGGLLTVYDLAYPSGGDVEALERRYRLEGVPPEVRRRGIPLEDGDLVVFDSGRRLHAVSRVESAEGRWSMGGGAAFSKDGRTLYYWSI